MQFLYHKDVGHKDAGHKDAGHKDARQADSGAGILELDGEEFNYLCRVRRFGVGKVVAMRNLRDGILYRYEILEVGKKSVRLGLVKEADSEISESSLLGASTDSGLHLLWAVIDPKVIEKTLPMLNELGVAKITLFYAQYSQHSFKPNLPRMEKILIQSCQQCGRAHLMELELLKNLGAVSEKYKDFDVFDFGGEDIREALRAQGALGLDVQGALDSEISESSLLESASSSPISHHTPLWRVMVGAEGGFSPAERESFKRTLSLPNAGILRSESACVFLASLAAFKL